MSAHTWEQSTRTPEPGPLVPGPLVPGPLVPGPLVAGFLGPGFLEPGSLGLERGQGRLSRLRQPLVACHGEVGG